MKNPLDLLTKRQKALANKEIREEGYCVLQKWQNAKGEEDLRVLKDTIIITPHSIFDKISWLSRKTI